MEKQIISSLVAISVSADGLTPFGTWTSSVCIFMTKLMFGIYKWPAMEVLFMLWIIRDITALQAILA